MAYTQDEINNASLLGVNLSNDGAQPTTAPTNNVVAQNGTPSNFNPNFGTYNPNQQKQQYSDDEINQAKQLGVDLTNDRVGTSFGDQLYSMFNSTRNILPSTVKDLAGAANAIHPTDTATNLANSMQDVINQNNQYLPSDIRYNQSLPGLNRDKLIAGIPGVAGTIAANILAPGSTTIGQTLAGAGGSYNEVKDNVKQQLLANGMNEQDAENQAQTQARKAALESGLLQGGANALTLGIAGKIGATNTLGKAALKAGLMDAPLGALQSGSQNVLNQYNSLTNPNQSIDWGQAGEAALEGSVSGLAMGGVLGAHESLGQANANPTTLRDDGSVVRSRPLNVNGANKRMEFLQKTDGTKDYVVEPYIDENGNQTNKHIVVERAPIAQKLDEMAEEAQSQANQPTSQKNTQTNSEEVENQPNEQNLTIAKQLLNNPDFYSQTRNSRFDNVDDLSNTINKAFQTNPESALDTMTNKPTEFLNEEHINDLLSGSQTETKLNSDDLNTLNDLVQNNPEQLKQYVQDYMSNIVDSHNQNVYDLAQQSVQTHPELTIETLMNKDLSPSDESKILSGIQSGNIDPNIKSLDDFSKADIKDKDLTSVQEKLKNNNLSESISNLKDKFNSVQTENENQKNAKIEDIKNNMTKSLNDFTSKLSDQKMLTREVKKSMNDLANEIHNVSQTRSDVKDNMTKVLDAFTSKIRKQNEAAKEKNQDTKYAIEHNMDKLLSDFTSKLKASTKDIRDVKESHSKDIGESLKKALKDNSKNVNHDEAIEQAQHLNPEDIVKESSEKNKVSLTRLKELFNKNPDNILKELEKGNANDKHLLEKASNSKENVDVKSGDVEQLLKTMKENPEEFKKILESSYGNKLSESDKQLSELLPHALSKNPDLALDALAHPHVNRAMELEILKGINNGKLNRFKSVSEFSGPNVRAVARSIPRLGDFGRIINQLSKSRGESRYIKPSSRSVEPSKVAIKSTRSKLESTTPKQRSRSNEANKSSRSELQQSHGEQPTSTVSKSEVSSDVINHKQINKDIKATEKDLNPEREIPTFKPGNKNETTEQQFLDKVLTTDKNGVKNISFSSHIQNAAKNQFKLTDLKVGDKLDIKREPSDHDHYNIAVYSNGKKVGMMDQRESHFFARYMDRNRVSNVKATYDVAPITKSRVDTSKNEFTNRHNIEGKNYYPMVKVEAKQNTEKLKYFKEPTLNKDDLSSTVKELKDDNYKPIIDSINKEFNNKTDKFNLHIIDNKQLNSDAEHLSDFINADKDSFGFYSKLFKTVGVNPENITKGITNENSLLHNMSIDDASKFIVNHELGHAALSDKFPNESDLHNYLRDLESNSKVFSNLADVKEKFYNISREDALEEAHQDLFAGKVVHLDKDGKVVLSDLKDYTDSLSNKGLLSDTVNFFKNAFNKLMGKDVFKFDDKDFSKTLEKIQSLSDNLYKDPENKAKNDYINSKILSNDTKVNALKYAKNPDILNSNDLRGDFKDKLYASKKFGLNNLKGFADLFKTPFTRSQTDKDFNEFYQKTERFQNDAEAFNKNDLDLIPRLLSKMNYKDINALNKVLINENKTGKVAYKTDLNDINHSRTYDDSKLSTLSDNAKSAYKQYREMTKQINEREGKTDLFQLAMSKGLLSHNNDEPLLNVNDYSMKQYRDAMFKRIDSSEMKPEAKQLLKDNLNEKYDDALEKNLKGYNPVYALGDHYVEVRDKQGNLKRLEMFNSKYDRDVAESSLKRSNDLSKYDIKTGEFTSTKDAFKNENHPDYKLLQEASKLDNYSPDLARTATKFAENSARDTSRKLNLSRANKFIDDFEKTSDRKDKAGLVKEMRSLATWVSQNSTHKAISKLKVLPANYYLGGSLSSGMGNVLSIMSNLGPYLNQYNGGRHVFGGMAEAGKTFFKHELKTSDVVNSSYFKGYDKADLSKATQFLINSGIMEKRSYHDISKIIAGKDIYSPQAKVFNTAMKLWMSPYESLERYTRRASIFAALKTGLEAKASGKLGKDVDLGNFAANALDSTQGQYIKANTPKWARNDIGQLLYQFKPFQLATANLFFRLPLKQKLMMGAVYGLGSGVLGLPFAQNIEDIINAVLHPQGYDTESAIKSVVGNKAESVIMHGLLSQFEDLTPISQRMEVGNIIPGTKLFDATNTNRTNDAVQALGPAVSIVKNLFNGATDVLSGNVKDGLKGMLPSGINNIATGVNALRTGEFRDKNGKLVTTDLNHGEALIKMLGFTPGRIQDFYEHANDIRTVNDLRAYANKNINDDYAQAVISKDNVAKTKAIDDLHQWNMNHPDMKISINAQALKTKIIQNRMDAKQRLLKSTNRELKPTVQNMLHDDD